MINLYLGCGERHIPGFIHVDIRKLPHVDYVISADNLDMFADNSVDLIYACHILEHFGRHKIDDVLKEWHRVLKPEAAICISVPDLEQLIKVYMKTNDLNLILGPLVGGQDYPENTHLMVFDYAVLSEKLQKAGFRNIHRYDWRVTPFKDHDDYAQAYIPHMDKEHGIPISLNVEAIKSCHIKKEQITDVTNKGSNKYQEFKYNALDFGSSRLLQGIEAIG